METKHEKLKNLENKEKRFNMDLIEVPKRDKMEKHFLFGGDVNDCKIKLYRTNVKYITHMWIQAA